LRTPDVLAAAAEDSVWEIDDDFLRRTLWERRSEKEDGEWCDLGRFLLNEPDKEKGPRTEWDEEDEEVGRVVKREEVPASVAWSLKVAPLMTPLWVSRPSTR
jgi:hypothetical protein